MEDNSSGNPQKIPEDVSTEIVQSNPAEIASLPKKNNFFIWVVVVVLLVVLTVGFLLIKSNLSQSKNNAKEPPVLTQTTQALIATSNNQEIKTEEQNYSVKQITIEDKNVSDWNKGSWQSYNFLYPKKFVLTDGGLDQKYFYLDYEIPPTDNLIRIFGVSEIWENKTLEEVVATRDEQEKNIPGFKFKTLEEDYITPDLHKKCETFVIDPNTYQACKFTKYFGKEFRILTITSEINNWQTNSEVFEDIVSHIR